MRPLALASFCALFAASLAVSIPASSSDLLKRDNPPPAPPLPPPPPSMNFLRPSPVDEWVVQRPSSQFLARWTSTITIRPDPQCDVSLNCGSGPGPIGWCYGETTFSAGSCNVTVAPPTSRGTYYHYCDVEMLCNIQGTQVRMGTSQSFPVAYAG